MASGPTATSTERRVRSFLQCPGSMEDGGVPVVAGPADLLVLDREQPRLRIHFDFLDSDAFRLRLLPKQPDADLLRSERRFRLLDALSPVGRQVGPSGQVPESFRPLNRTRFQPGCRSLRSGCRGRGRPLRSRPETPPTPAPP